MLVVSVTQASLRKAPCALGQVCFIDRSAFASDATHASKTDPPQAGAGQPLQFFCNALPHVSCTRLRYHCTRHPDVDLCAQAYAEGRFPPGTSAKDFIRVEATSATADATGWSAQETLLLLEGMELHGEAWAKVAEHVGTKSKLDCVLRFAQLPIDEDLLNDLEVASQQVRS